MANAEIECIVRDTRELMSQIASGERRVDEMIRRVNTVSEKMACMREYQNIMNAVNAYTINGARRTVLLEELQRENRQILAYHEENRNLREAIDESMETLGAVMARHRMVMARMGRISKQPSFKEVTSLFPAEFIDKTSDKDRVRRVILNASDCMTSAEDEDAAHLETICRLVLENQGLRELLNAATIATPDMKEKFSRALAASRAKNDEKMMNGTLASSDDGSDTEGELDSTAVEMTGKRRSK